MTLSLPRFGRFSVFALALVYTGLSFGVATSTPLAAQGGPYYTATLASPASDDRAVAGGVAWICEGTTCVANKGDSRPERVCRGLAREFGEIAAFTANGEALSEAKLAACNGK